MKNQNIKYIIIGSGITIVSLIMLYFGVLIWRAAASDLKWTDMDLNKDGHTTILEYLEAGDTIKRTLQKNGENCTEYVLLKDGSIIKVVCPSDIN